MQVAVQDIALQENPMGILWLLSPGGVVCILIPLTEFSAK
jgi:hypothetical protein